MRRGLTQLRKSNDTAAEAGWRDEDGYGLGMRGIKKCQTIIHRERGTTVTPRYTAVFRDGVYCIDNFFENSKNSKKDKDSGYRQTTLINSICQIAWPA